MQPKKPLNDYARYSGIAAKMLVIILAGVFAGKWLDTQIPGKFPVFTVVLTILSVALSMYSVIKDLLKKK